MKVSSLKILHLVKNQLTHLPEDMSNWTLLRELGIARNELKKLPESIGTLKNLREISLSKNPLSTSKPLLSITTV